MLADSHIHLFENGYKGSGEHELQTYLALMDKFSIEHAIVVGFEGEPWAVGNNSYIGGLKATNSWMHPLAFVKPSALTLHYLQELQSHEFVGLTFYLFRTEEIAELKGIDGDVWRWLVERKWIISVNSTGEFWLAWLDILRDYPDLILLISHLGLPIISTDDPVGGNIAIHLNSVKQLSDFRNVYLKLSGFYALEPKTPLFPYLSLNPYLEYIVANFAVERLIWGSDFTPALDSVDFAQTFKHFSMLAFLSPTQISKILHHNLIELLFASGNLHSS
jgi:L-fuconolactonase